MRTIVQLDWMGETVKGETRQPTVLEGGGARGERRELVWGSIGTDLEGIKKWSTARYRDTWAVYSMVPVSSHTLIFSV